MLLLSLTKAAGALEVFPQGLKIEPQKQELTGTKDVTGVKDVTEASLSDGKASACNAGDPGSIPGSGRSPGEKNGNPLQHSCLENRMDGGA